MLDEKRVATDPEAGAPPAAPANARIVEITRRVTLALFALVAVGAVFGNYQRAQAAEPARVYEIVARTVHFGGGWYANGIHDKGPLELLVYHAATWLSSHDGYWYAISFFVAIAAVIVAAAAAATARAFGANRDVGLAVAAVVFVHFALSGAGYAGVLTARDITATLLAAVWLGALSVGPALTRRGALIVAMVAGLLLGLAVQTVFATAFATLAVAAIVLLTVRVRPRPERVTLLVAFVGSAFVAFVSAPVWYALRGQSREFVAGWWTYARFENVGAGHTLAGQFALGWDRLYAYYQLRPLTFFALVAFIVMMVHDSRRSSERIRVVEITLIAWLAGGWLDLVLTQQYSADQFVVTSVPTALMIAALAGRAYRAIADQPGSRVRTFAWPLLALMFAIYFSGPKYFVDSMRELSGFTSVHQHALDVDKTEAGDVRTARAVLDLVSRDRDPLLEWSNDPTAYVALNRMAATRFITKSTVIGEIVTGQANHRYVLPETSRWFDIDVARSAPAAFIDAGGDIPTGSDVQHYVDTTFTPVFPATPAIEFRNDLASAVLQPATARVWVTPSAPAPGTGWTTEAGSATYDTGAGDRATDLLPIAAGWCNVISGTVASDGSPGGVAFHFRFADSADELQLVFDGDHVDSAGQAGVFESVASGVKPATRAPVPFTLLVGKRAAALIVEGRIRGAVQLRQSPSIAAESLRSHLELAGMQAGPAPAATGC